MKRDIHILGIDTSCDDTSASVVRNGTDILSNIVSSQSGIHARYGGIVPELASRSHVEMIWPVVNDALAEAGTGLEEVDAIAVCYGPGLIGSLLVGCSFAKSVCYNSGTKLIGINHLEGHMFASVLKYGEPSYPFLSLVVSGGHSSIYLVRKFDEYEELGRTRDDAVGEAYDKVAKMLGLGYPGGPVIDDLSKRGKSDAVDFPRPYLPDTLDLSFSGLKTAVRNFIPKATEGEASVTVEDICASFQKAVVDVLVRKTEWAVKKTGVKRLTMSGGVAANSELRASIASMADRKGVILSLPPAELCTDNAAMIAVAGYFRFRNGESSEMTLNPKAHLPL